MNDLAGVFPPIPTPFDEDGELALSRLKENLAVWESKPLSGYVVGGSNGEFVHLSEDEQAVMVTSVKELMAPERRLIAGAGTASTRGTIANCRRAAEAGADAALVLAPGYYRNLMTSEALLAHFVAVADSSPIPIVLYNVPANTGVNLPEEAVVALAAHPNIFGMKDSSGDVARMANLVLRCGEEFKILAGSGGYFLPALSVGAVGCVAALANIAAEELAQIWSQFQSGDSEAAAQLQRRLVEPNRAVTSRYGVPGLKAALDLLGLYGGPVRSPLQPLTTSERAQLGRILEGAGLLPAE
jgi:4-hydroxy-2-oxoglutarate aldolase